MNRIFTHIEESNTQNIQHLQDLLKFKSISADPAFKEDVQSCAIHVSELIKTIGLESRVIQTAGAPIVYGEYSHPDNNRTLLIYGHYDVQPVDPIDLWTHPPFEPHIEGDTIYARGASDDKGQFLIHLLAIDAYLKTQGSLPVNLKLLIEGEEETAADNLEIFIKENKELLKADGVVVSDTAMYGENAPAITYGLRGIAVAEIKVTGPSKDLHSGSFGGSLANPITELARIVTALHDQDYRIAIDGFYDKVRMLEDWEKQMFASLDFDEKAYLDSTGSCAVSGEKGFTTLERKWSRPTCDVNGIYGGYAGEGGKTIIPSWAGCKVTMRLVPDQDPDQILKQLDAYVKKIASPAVKTEVSLFGGAKPAIVARDSFLVKGCEKAIKKGFDADCVFIREGGSIPIVNVFKEELGLDTLLLGFGQHDDNVHSPNEKFSLINFQKGIKIAACLFDEISRL